MKYQRLGMENPKPMPHERSIKAKQFYSKKKARFSSAFNVIRQLQIYYRTYRASDNCSLSWLLHRRQQQRRGDSDRPARETAAAEVVLEIPTRFDRARAIK